MELCVLLIQNFLHCIFILICSYSEHSLLMDSHFSIRARHSQNFDKKHKRLTFLLLLLLSINGQNFQIINDVDRLDPDVVELVFQKHCAWKPPSSFLETLHRHQAYPLPFLINASLHHCSGSSLPFASVDLWYHHADVAVERGSDVTVVQRSLHESCNDPARDRACLIFYDTEMIWSDHLGAELILDIVHHPFVLVTAGNSVMCTPIPEYPSKNRHLGVELLLRSPLLIRWYSKNPCIYAGHLDWKMLPLPLGPKFQFQSTEFGGEDKDAVKKVLMDAGAGDPRALFLSGEKLNRISAAMWLPTSDNPPFKFNRHIRWEMKEAIDKAGFPSESQASGDEFWVDSEMMNHSDYLFHLANSRFSLAPPGAGLSTHRAWESLHLGTIPILLYNAIAPCFSKLPVVFICDFNLVNSQTVQDWLSRIHSDQDSFSWIRLLAFWWYLFTHC